MYVEREVFVGPRANRAPPLRYRMQEAILDRTRR